MPTCWRLVHENHLSAAFSGAGARLAGGRWNSEGFAVVYTAGSLSLALLEIIVHLEFKETLKYFRAIPVDIHISSVRTVDPESLPSGWNDALPHPSTQLIGNRWIRDLSSPVLQVPSAIVPLENNYLLNPAHPDFSGVQIGDAVRLPVDLRVMEKLK